MRKINKSIYRLSSSVRHLKRTKLSPQYIAGFFDGEGHIGICKGVVKHKNKVYEQIYDRVKIDNTKPEVLYMIRDIFGGKVSRKYNGYNKKDCYTFFVFSYESERFLKTIYPYLHIKRKQAEIMLDFYKTKHKITKIGDSLSRKDRNKRLNLMIKIKKLNKRGLK